MIIQSKIQGQGLWSVIVLCGSLVAACSGTIDTPTEEFPPRQGGSQAADDDDDNDSPRPPANPPTASNNDDDDEPAPTANDDDDEPLPVDDEEDPPADDEEDPPADDEEPPAADLSFEADIAPIFTSSCGGCHGPGGFGGVSIADSDVEAALESAIAAEDAVIQNIENGDMPPPCGGGAPGDSGCISADDFADVQAWYAAGAPE